MTSDIKIESIITYFKDIEPKKTEWLWPERIPLGTLTLIVGNPNMGKTFLTIFIAARVSTGNFWPDRTQEKYAAAMCRISRRRENLKGQVGELLLYLQSPLTEEQQKSYWRIFERKLREYVDLKCPHR